MAGLAHPSKPFYLCAALFALLCLVFAIAATIIPAWSRIPGVFIQETLDLLPYTSSTAGYTVTDKSKLHLGQWQWCLDYGDNNNTYTCSNAGDGSQAPSFGDPKCEGFLYASRILGVIAIGFAFFALLATIFTLTKVLSWHPESIWKKPTGPAAAAFLLMLLTLGLLLATWICWIVLAEHSCRSDTTSYNPFQGYSTSFILECFASGFALFALLGLCLGLLKLGKAPKAAPQPKQQEVEYIMEAPPAYPVTAPSYPITQPYMAPVSYPVETYGQQLLY